MSERGIEQTMEAILEVPDAVLVLLGFGDWAERLWAQSEAPPYRGRVIVLPAVPPAELVDWTASPDVMVMAIQPTTRQPPVHDAPEAVRGDRGRCAVVASDLPGMAAIVQASRGSASCATRRRPPRSPRRSAGSSSARPEDRAALRAHVLEVARERYNWGAQLSTLLGLYRELAPPPVPHAEPRREATSAS